jgi:hypothetical protein
MLTFDEKEHRYQWCGITVPSVTQILGEWVRVDIGRGWYVSTFTGQAIDAETFEAAGRMGTAIHDMLHAYLQDDLDEGGTSPELLKVLAQFKAWQETFKPEIELAEAVMYSEKYGYAGTMDCVCKIGRDHWLIDWKSGAFSTAGPQLAAYEKLYQETTESRLPLKRAVLSLPKNGEKFKWLPQTSREDWPFFQARLYQYNYLNKGRK